MDDQGRDHRSWSPTIWLTLAVCGAVATFVAQRATAEPQTPFDQLAELDREATHHELAAARIERSIRRWERQYRSVAREGEFAQRAERARSRLRERAARQLVDWEIVHRRITRRQMLWRGGLAGDLRRLLRPPEMQSLRAERELFSTIGRLQARMVDPGEVIQRRAGLTVELAQHRAAGEVADAEKGAVVENARRGGGEGLEEELEKSQQDLEHSLERLIEHETGDDFHKRKGTLMPPVPVEVAHGYGERKQDDSMTYVRHTGLTYEIDLGMPVRATAAGMVVFTQRMRGYGNVVIVDHGDDYHSLYAHLSQSAVEVGDEVERGESVGAAGATDSLSGPKLYFELRHETEPIDPQPWFVRRKKSENADAKEASADEKDSEQ